MTIGVGGNFYDCAEYKCNNCEREETKAIIIYMKKLLDSDRSKLVQLQ